MNQKERLEIFEKLRAEHSVFLLSVLWKLTGYRELFTEAMQYTLMGMWEHIEKLNGRKAGAYIYRIALSANSKAWRNRIAEMANSLEAKSVSTRIPARNSVSSS
jgi:DNA-directed RNA polymerase specialized sigma24 family protein